MRVLHIVTAFPRHEQDVITPWLVEMLKKLKVQGAEVEVFTSSYQGLSDQTLFGIPVHRFRYFFSPWENLTHEEMAIDRMTRSPLYKILPGFYLIGGLIGALKLCRRNKYDVIHVHWPMPHAVFGWAAKKACRARLVTTFYGAELRWVKNLLPFLKWFLRWAIKISDRVAAISTFTASEVKSISDVPVEVIPYTVGFPTNSKFKIQNSKFGEPVILTVGRMVERKGVRYLIEAMQQLPQARLEVVGGGPLLEELQSLTKHLGVADRVRFAGKISEQELIDHYRRAAVYVQPGIIDARGDTEMLGVALLEAMNYHVPVIGSDLGGITDIIIHEKTGLLVPQKDPQALARAIQRILSEKGLGTKLADEAYRHLTTNFSWDNIVSRWMAIYRS
ncbi:glycosyltransferase family 4 protein [candidate division TA06 bacterium]|uniref:Glycosyltransferase family 4 protein n=1 Tax=candidate division TA06 bacterium TaxID=2250710 RepID=A0A933IC25_UNCT6|nr:glycosyltransferase family 4 protein [candidate division TA06 bacterium]